MPQRTVMNASETDSPLPGTYCSATVSQSPNAPTNWMPSSPPAGTSTGAKGTPSVSPKPSSSAIIRGSSTAGVDTPSRMTSMARIVIPIGPSFRTVKPTPTSRPSANDAT